MDELESKPCLIVQVVVNSIITNLCATLLSILIGSMAAYALVRIQYKPKIGNIAAFFVLSFGTIVVSSYSAVPWYLASAVAAALFFFLARALGRRFKATVGNRGIMFWIVSQRILPPMVVAIPAFMFFQSAGLLDTTEALVFLYAVTNLPRVVGLRHDFFAGLPVDLEESAALEGATHFRIFWEIALPLSRPGLAATALLCFILNWNEYIFAVFLTTTKAITLPVFAEMWGESTIMLAMVVPAIVMAALLQRYIDRGILLGGVKG